MLITVLTILERGNVSNEDAGGDLGFQIHPTDCSKSTTVAADKLASLAVYDVASNEIRFLSNMIPLEEDFLC
jgi:myo-inositol-hexaphosphate 3-phosphohydrolase